MKKNIFIAALIITLLSSITYVASAEEYYSITSPNQRDWRKGPRYTDEEVDAMLEKARLREEAALREQQKNRKQKEPEQQKSYWDF